jgi:hypothetical protein
LPTVSALHNKGLPKTNKQHVAQWRFYDRRAYAYVWPLVDEFYADGSVKVITLTRENLLERYVSARYARANSVWHVNNRKTRRRMGASRPVEINVQAAMRDVARKKADEAEMLVRFPDALHLTYEQLTDERDLSLHTAQVFLGVAPQKLVPRTSKITTKWPNRVVNYSELHAHFTGTEYEPYLYM